MALPSSLSRRPAAVAPSLAGPLPGLLLGLALGLLAAAGCARRGAAPEAFPPVRLGMARVAARDALAAAGARIVEESPRMLRAVGRDSRVAEEVFLFYDGRLAAWTQHLAEPASRASFARVSRQLAHFYGAPTEERDDGLVLAARYRLGEEGGRVLLSGYVGDGKGSAPLMVRVEDASVLRSLVRELAREDRAGSDSADSGDAARRTAP
jgi:hypothetical protein